MEIFETGELPLNPNITDKKSHGGKTILMTLIMFGKTLKAKNGSPLAHKFLFNYGNGINLLQITPIQKQEQLLACQNHC